MTFDLLTRLRARRAFDTAEAGAGAGGDPAAGAAAAVLTTPPEGAPAAGGAAPASPPASSTPWWQDTKRFDDGARTMLTAKGLTVDDPLDAVGKLAQLYTNAEKRLGKPADQLLDKPGKDQPVTDWMKANADLFGIPEAPDKYDLKRPESWPKDAPWNEAAEAKLRGKAHELGLSGAQAQAMVDLYAETVAEVQGSAAAGLQQSQEQLMAELKKDWGDATSVKVTQAQQAWQALAEMAGLDADATLNAAAALSEKAGDANVLRLFAALGASMGEDMLTRVPGGGGGSIGMTPAEARAELAAMTSPDSEYGKAVKAKRDGRAPANWAQLEERRAFLTRLAAQK